MSAPPPFADTSPSVPPEDELPPEPPPPPAPTPRPGRRPRAALPPVPPPPEQATTEPPASEVLDALPPAVAPANPAGSGSVWQAEEDSAISSLQRAMVGPVGAAHYLPVFARFEAADRVGPGWNWAASLCTLNWLFFRRLWGPMLAYLGALAGGALLVFGLGRLVLHLSQAEETSLLVAMATLAVLVPGGLGDAWLYRQYRRRSEEALAQAPTLQEACALLARQASSRQRLLGIVAANVALAAALLTGWSVFSPAAAPGRTVATTPAVDTPRRASGNVVPEAPVVASTSAAFGSGAPGSQPAPEAVQPAPLVGAAPPPLPTVAATMPRSDTPPASDMRGITPSVRIVLAPEPSAAAASAPTWYPPPGAMASYVTRWREPVAPPPPAAATPIGSDAAVAAQAAPVAAPAPASKPGTRDAAKPARKVAEKAAEKPSTRGSAAAAKASDKPPAVPAGRYVVNIGLFGDPANTQKALTALRGAKVRLLVEELDMPNGRRTRVRAGPYATRAQAEAEASRIRALKLEAVVARQ